MVRTCDRCGQRYLRRNLIEAWTTRNPGHRRGWIKKVIRICLRCQSIERSKEVVAVAQIRVVEPDTAKTAKRLLLRART